MQRPAKPCTPVRFRPWPPLRLSQEWALVHERQVQAATDRRSQTCALIRERSSHRAAMLAVNLERSDARVAKSVNAADLKSAGSQSTLAGSSPAPGSSMNGCALGNPSLRDLDDALEGNFHGTLRPPPDEPSFDQGIENVARHRGFFQKTGLRAAAFKYAPEPCCLFFTQRTLCGAHCFDPPESRLEGKFSRKP